MEYNGKGKKKSMSKEGKSGKKGKKSVLNQILNKAASSGKSKDAYNAPKEDVPMSKRNRTKY